MRDQQSDPVVPYQNSATKKISGGSGKKVIPFVRKIEKVIIDTLSTFSISAFSKHDDTGVWTKEGKIASIGIKVSKWTTFHGFSLNITDNTKGYDFINPCGDSEERIVAIQNYDNS